MLFLWNWKSSDRLWSYFFVNGFLICLIEIYVLYFIALHIYYGILSIITISVH